MVRMKVAKSEPTFSMPTLAKMAVSAAKPADSTAQNCQEASIALSPRRTDEVAGWNGHRRFPRRRDIADRALSVSALGRLAATVARAILDALRLRGSGGA